MTIQDVEDGVVDDVAAKFDLDRQTVIVTVSEVGGIGGLPDEVEPIDLVVYAAGRMGYQADL